MGAPPNLLLPAWEGTGVKAAGTSGVPYSSTSWPSRGKGNQKGGPRSSGLLPQDHSWPSECPALRPSLFVPPGVERDLLL